MSRCVWDWLCGASFCAASPLAQELNVIADSVALHVAPADEAIQVPPTGSSSNAVGPNNELRTAVIVLSSLLGAAAVALLAAAVVRRYRRANHVRLPM
ncbi:hypothetical protein EON66_05885 [archaeon]|nr:MAG: hypothetical protein EON66_05885 [archaeon]